jgi:diguanylate cyclase (GGDEF)-like protein
LNLRHARLYEYLSKSPKGSFETYAATDGLHRLVVYAQVADLPLVLGIGQATYDIYAPWYRYALPTGGLVLLLSIGFIVGSIFLARELKRRAAAEAQLASLAATDVLTGLGNRRSFDETVNRELRRCFRDGKPLALMLVDLDFFKSHNDLYGHQAGDERLRSAGRAIAEILRRGEDHGFRYGGDEFSIILSGTSGKEAMEVDKRLRGQFAAYKNLASQGISIGIVAISGKYPCSPEMLLKWADDALYEAKTLGRNQTRMFELEAVESDAGDGSRRLNAA